MRVGLLEVEHNVRCKDVGSADSDSMTKFVGGIGAVSGWEGHWDGGWSRGRGG